MTLDDFLGGIAARTPAPGGGAGAAVGCALAAALAEMAARFAGFDAAAARAGALRSEGLRLADEDLSAYAPVIAALGLAKDDPARPERLAAAARLVEINLADTVGDRRVARARAAAAKADG